MPLLASVEVETLLFDTTTWLDAIADPLDKTVAGIGKVHGIVKGDGYKSVNLGIKTLNSMGDVRENTVRYCIS